MVVALGVELLQRIEGGRREDAVASVSWLRFAPVEVGEFRMLAYSGSSSLLLSLSLVILEYR